MNKLAEIKEAKEEYEAKGFMPHIESVGEIERVSCEFHNKAYDRISYLLSLLEEKDKALAFYEDVENWTPYPNSVNYECRRSFHDKVYKCDTRLRKNRP